MTKIPKTKRRKYGMNETLVNEMSAQPAFIYSFEYLSGWNSNRNTGAFFQETNSNLKKMS